MENNTYRYPKGGRLRGLWYGPGENAPPCPDCGTRDGMRQLTREEAAHIQDDEGAFYVNEQIPRALYTRWFCYRENHGDPPHWFREATAAEVDAFIDESCNQSPEQLALFIAEHEAMERDHPELLKASGDKQDYL